jgi:hypothetical protein
MASERALVGPEDAGLIVDTIEMILPETRKIDRLDLFLHSPGGFLESATRIIGICKEYSEEFNVIVPLAAKSAATVICLGANEIVMTVFAELGPIDPIIQHPYKPDVRVPARSIKDFFEFLSSTETGKITVDSQFKVQMSNLLDPYLIGSYQTALNSSKQIAEKLLKENALKDKSPQLVDEAVKRLTEYYYSHSYGINRKEAKEIGLNVIKAESTPQLDQAIRLLLRVYQQFMMQNSILKLVGNRELNRNIQQPVQVPPQIVTPSKPVNLIF